MSMPAFDLEAESIRRFTRREYHELGRTGIFDQERVELVHGIIRRKPVIGPRHAYTVGQLMKLFVRLVGSQAEVRVQQPVAASDDSEPEPDVAVCPPGNYLDDHPEVAWLIVEVAASSLKMDRGEKARVYAAMGALEYWVVNLKDGVVEVHRAPGPEGYATVEIAQRGAELRVPGLPDVVVAVDQILPPA